MFELKKGNSFKKIISKMRGNRIPQGPLIFKEGETAQDCFKRIFKEAGEPPEMLGKGYIFLPEIKEIDHD